jgi:hypothetical protein
MNRLKCLAFGIVAGGLVALSSSAIIAQQTPKTNPPKLRISGPALGSAPQLSDPKHPASETVPAFIEWASHSGIKQRDEVRRMIGTARNDSAVARELCREVSAREKTDLSRTLVSLSILGELRNSEGEKCSLARTHFYPRCAAQQARIACVQF